MNGVRVLLVDDANELPPWLTRVVSDEGFELHVAPTGWNGDAIDPDDDFDILLVHVHANLDRISALLSTVRRRLLGSPVQVIGIAGEEAEYRSIIELGADDVVSRSASAVELGARLRAASFRLEEQVRLLRESEFFRRQVREEETVNSRILARNRMLTDAYRSLEGMKRALEESNIKLQQVARYDILSGLLSRVALISTIDSEIERAVRCRLPLSGFMSDIDNFKSINDNWGHPSGDMVIKNVGARLTRSLRKYDQAGRYGGEEFFVILPNAGVERARMVAERFRQSLIASPLMLGDENLRVTTSIGVAEFNPSEARDAWIKRADQAMYLAKHQGRDRVCVLN